MVNAGLKHFISDESSGNLMRCLQAFVRIYGEGSSEGNIRLTHTIQLQPFLEPDDGMLSDDLTWSIISENHCSYQYATVKEKDGKIYLYVRHAERMAYPNKQWERILLSNNKERALEQIDEHLIYWRHWNVRKVKLRFQRLMEVQKNQRRLEKSKLTKRIVAVSRKQEKRENRREKKALIAAQLDSQIEKELLERLKSGVKEDILNLNQRAFERVLDAEEESESEEEIEYTSASDLEEEDLEEDIEDLGDLEEEEEEEPEMVKHASLKKKRPVISYDDDDSADEVMEH